MQVLSLIKELSLLAERQKGLRFDGGLEERLCAYARSVAHFPTAIKEVSDHFRHRHHKVKTNPQTMLEQRKSEFQFRLGEGEHLMFCDR